MALRKQRSIKLKRPLSYQDVADIAHWMHAEANVAGSLNSLMISRKPDDLAPIRDYFSIAAPDERNFIRLERGDIGDDELVVALSRLPKKFQPFVAQVIEEFSLPEFTQRHQDIRDSQDSQNQGYKERIRRANAQYGPVKNDRDVPLESGKVKLVAQSLSNVLRGDAQDTVLATEGVTSCVVVTMFNPETHDIAMAHLASSNDLRQLDTMQQELQGDGHGRVEVQLWGGRQNQSEALVNNILDHIDSFRGMELTAVDVCDPARRDTLLNGIILSRDGRTRLETSEVIRDVTNTHFEDFHYDEEEIQRLIREVRGISPTSIKPDREAMRRQDISRSKGDSESGSSS